VILPDSAFVLLLVATVVVASVRGFVLTLPALPEVCVPALAGTPVFITLLLLTRLSSFVCVFGDVLPTLLLPDLGMVLPPAPLPRGP
jgi:hypothetical protein